MPIDDVARHHPARVILLHHDPDASGQDDESAAHVGAADVWPARCALRRGANSHPVPVRRGGPALDRAAAGAWRCAHDCVVDRRSVGVPSAHSARDHGAAASVRQPALARRPCRGADAGAPADGRVQAGFGGRELAAPAACTPGSRSRGALMRSFEATASDVRPHPPPPWRSRAGVAVGGLASGCRVHRTRPTSG